LGAGRSRSLRCGNDEGTYHKGREEVVYRCEAGHELRREREFTSADPMAGQRPEDVFGRDVYASWLENEANVGERETLLGGAAKRLRGESDEEETRAPDKNEPGG